MRSPPACPTATATVIEQPIGMHPHQREKMAIRAGHSTSREATTFYEVRRAIRRLCGGEGAAEDGPDASDSRPPGPHRLPGAVRQAVRRPLVDHARRAARHLPHGPHARRWPVILCRQALHARRIKLAHPATGEPIEFVAPLPEDLASGASTSCAAASEQKPESNRRQQRDEEVCIVSFLCVLCYLLFNLTSAYLPSSENAMSHVASSDIVAVLGWQCCSALVLSCGPG